VVWQGFYKAVPVIEKWMAWCLRNGANIRLGEDPIIGSNHFFQLPSQLVNYLRMGGSRGNCRPSLWFLLFLEGSLEGIGFVLAF
jgi:hypothetical protein